MGRPHTTGVDDPTIDSADDRVLVAVKTPLMRRPGRWFLPRELTLGESVDALRRTAPQDGGGRNVLEQLEREMSGSAFQFLVVSEAGTVAPAPSTTRLSDIAYPREMRTPDGLERKVSAASFEVQAYAPVGV